MSHVDEHPVGDLAGLRFKVTELRRRPGSRSTERRVVQPVAPDGSPGLTIGGVRVAALPATVDVVMESLNDGVRVWATVQYHWEGACRRCLGAAEGTATSEILELFVDDRTLYEGFGGGPSSEGRGEGSHSESGTSESGPSQGSGAGGAEGEVHELANGWVDLSKSVRDALLLGLPLAPLCEDDCAGPSPEEFPVEVQTEIAAAVPDSACDPRWAALNDLRFDPERT